MIVVEDGAAYVLNQLGWLAFLEDRAAGSSVRAASFGCGIGLVLGEVSDLLSVNAGSSTNELRSTKTEIVVTENDCAFLLGEDEWLCYLADSLAGNAGSISDYGDDLGPVAPASDALTGVCAGILAAGVRASINATAARGPGRSYAKAA